MLKFGDCYINETKTSTLTLTNHHASDCVRFVWPDHPNLTFKPKVGHLHAGCTKEVSVSFTCEKALSLEEAEVAAKLTRIAFDRPPSEVHDWDDRLRSVRWVDAAPPPAPASLSNKPVSASSTRSVSRSLPHPHAPPTACPLLTHLAHAPPTACPLLTHLAHAPPTACPLLTHLAHAPPTACPLLTHLAYAPPTVCPHTGVLSFL